MHRTTCIFWANLTPFSLQCIYNAYGCEHGILRGVPTGVLEVGATVQLVPSDLYSTVNRHACLVGVRDCAVESVFPIDARYTSAVHVPSNTSEKVAPSLLAGQPAASPVQKSVALSPEDSDGAHSNAPSSPALKALAGGALKVLSSPALAGGAGGGGQAAGGAAGARRGGAGAAAAAASRKNKRRAPEPIFEPEAMKDMITKACAATAAASGLPESRADASAPVYLAAVMEYLTAEMVEAAGNVAQADNVRSLIVLLPSH
jgi:hypothetical protein